MQDLDEVYYQDFHLPKHHKTTEPMTPEEKARELYMKFYYELYALTALRPRVAKQCALIAVEEILELVKSDESAIIVQLQYWQQVKTEIEKI